MIPVAFTYHRAETLDDAVARITENPDAKILAGGHSLVPAMKLRLAAPSELVDITGLSELKSVSIGDAIEIGALVTYNELMDNDELHAVCPIFRSAIEQLGDLQVRARGTFGGSVAHADPAADLTGVFLALGGTVHARGHKGDRSIPVEEYFVDLWTTALAPDEVLTCITIPTPGPDAKMVYLKHRHPASGYAVVGVAAIRDGDSVRVTLTGATSKPERLIGAEQALADGLNTETIQAAAEHATDGVVINGDLYADEEYRSHLVRVLVKRALEAIA